MPVTPPDHTNGSVNPDRDTTLGSYVRERRVAHQMSLRDLAQLAGVGVRFLLELEHGKPTLRIDRVDAVLKVFGKRLGVIDRERSDP